MSLDLQIFRNLNVIWLAVIVTILAIVTKFIGCAFANVGIGWRRSIQIGVGMVPRGEVGLSFGVISGSFLPQFCLWQLPQPLLLHHLSNLLLQMKTRLEIRLIMMMLVEFYQKKNFRPLDKQTYQCSCFYILIVLFLTTRINIGSSNV